MHTSVKTVSTKRRTRAELVGGHDRLIRRLTIVLPVAITLIVAMMVAIPLGPRPEATLLIDRNKVAITDQRIAVSKAVYAGRDDAGRPFSLSVERAVQPSTGKPVVIMTNLMATLELSDGFAKITAPSGNYDFERGLLGVPGRVDVVAPNGLRLTTSDVLIDLSKHHLSAKGGVHGVLSAGEFGAETLAVDLDARTVTLNGGARLQMVPGKLEFLP